MSDTSDSRRAVFGGGCFWCTEALFASLRGVHEVVPGYAGGQTANPSYDAVCSGATGHAEVIRVTFDPSQIAYTDLLTVFFGTHDATTKDRQGNDVGAQYRSIILYDSEEQKAQANKKISDLTLQGVKIVTEVKPLKEFYPAEEDHRGYYQKNTEQPYCQMVINPKLEKLKTQFNALLKNAQ
ncbi:MAG: peptide-methionine (S)-S-oxide reductase MsrA [bacterium]|nr:peptide-methionine (S)-S-oxide reductase MsrA [bacterium]